MMNFLHEMITCNYYYVIHIMCFVDPSLVPRPIGLRQTPLPLCYGWYIVVLQGQAMVQRGEVRIPPR